MPLTCKKCDKFASFNLPRIRPPIYCYDHKTQKMVDVNRKCLSLGCKNHPGYDFPGVAKITTCKRRISIGHGRFCILHKKDGMINVVVKRGTIVFHSVLLDI